MINKITLADFKSYVSAELPLAPLTVLIGANASGKSNALEALRFLSWLAQGQQLSHLQYLVNNDDDRIVRGTVADLFRFDQDSFSLGCQFDREEFNHLEIDIERRADQELHISREEMFQYKADGMPYPLYATASKSSGDRTTLRVAYNNFASGGKKPQLPATDQKAIFLQLDSPARFAATHEKAIKTIPRLCADTQQQLAGILFLDPTPHKMRESSYLSERILRGDGSNLSAMLYRLWERGDDKDRKALLTFVSSLPEQAITGFSFLSGAKGDVLLQAVETFGGQERKVDATLLSDGTLRVLAFATAMLTAPTGSLVIIEEIDNGLHPSRAHMLLQAVRALAQQRKLSVLISSHNPALLDALPDDSIPDVVFCYRAPEKGDSQLVRMADIDNYPSLILQGSLGELLTKGLIDRYAKMKKQPQQRVKEGLAWLESITE
ncbi:AAA family ATPase [Neolewinella aurantiaca]|uniref:AAA family ATPase n=1 Tax=Neolewinella aurantiaca TaxID=2602767 RepID=A0A5C7FUZ7_9BACT|nr:ATP-binding protein [Neolewinella aurantiaca]TXF89329.1 AAA family ATPase [Neolewinella aurantiaca]